MLPCMVPADTNIHKHMQPSRQVPFQVVLQSNSTWICPCLESIKEYFSLIRLLFTTSDKLISTYPRDSVLKCICRPMFLLITSTCNWSSTGGSSSCHWNVWSHRGSLFLLITWHHSPIHPPSHPHQASTSDGCQAFRSYPHQAFRWAFCSHGWVQQFNPFNLVGWLSQTDVLYLQQTISKIFAEISNYFKKLGKTAPI
jgi:hypothetical protein